jgi:phage shock protein A
LIEQYIDNEFYDEECVEADKELENIKGEDVQYKKKMKRVSSIMERLSRSVHELKNRYDEIDIAELLGRKRNKKREA